ncbi:hypothetical protein LguiA_025886 [Lonicera macranthoides]
MTTWISRRVTDTEDTLSVYLEYVFGGSIDKLLQEYGSFREPVMQNYTRQILSGLAYLHGRNTVQRDIKGANILVDPNGEIKLADFGMTKHSSLTFVALTSCITYVAVPLVSHLRSSPARLSALKQAAVDAALSLVEGALFGSQSQDMSVIVNKVYDILKVTRTGDYENSMVHRRIRFPKFVSLSQSPSLRPGVSDSPSLISDLRLPSSIIAHSLSSSSGGPAPLPLVK